MARYKKIFTNTRHGLKETKLYYVWGKTIDRCENSNNKKYPNYGARGISVCNEWRYDFLKFNEWAHKNGYKEGLTLDRRDNDGNYCPENCRWVTNKENSQNTRNNKFYTLDGETKCLSEWLRDKRCLVSQPTLSKRIKEGWSFEKAITTPSWGTPKNLVLREDGRFERESPPKFAKHNP